MEKFIIVITLFYMVILSSYDVFRGKKTNIEFLLYSLILLVILNIGIYIHRKIQLPEIIIIGLSLFGFMHVLGGVFYVDGTRLYEKYFIFGFIRYDNIVHIIGAFLTTLVLNSSFHFFVEKNIKIHFNLYFFSLVLMALGVGTINEMLELGAVTMFNVEGRVGDYNNNAIDLVYNCIGSILAIILIDLYRKHKDSKHSLAFIFKYIFKEK